MHSLEYYTRQKSSWEHDEVQQITNEYQYLQKTISELADIHKRTPGSISYKLKNICLLYTSPSPRDRTRSRMPSSA